MNRFDILMSLNIFFLILLMFDTKAWLLAIIIVIQFIAGPVFSVEYENYINREKDG